MPMKTLVFLITNLSLGLQLKAAVPKNKKYEGEVAGIFCSACSSHVKAALMTIDGVQSVKITTAPKNGLPKLFITSQSDQPLTQEMAIKALGEKAKIFHIQSLKPITP